jgi:hypothetical protein
MEATNRAGYLVSTTLPVRLPEQSPYFSTSTVAVLMTALTEAALAR